MKGIIKPKVHPPNPNSMLTTACIAFAQKFGRYEEDAELWALPAKLSSIMTSTPFLGKLIVRVLVYPPRVLLAIVLKINK